MGVSELAFCGGALAFGHFYLRLNVATVQTLPFFVLVCGNQATMYAVRARGRIWSSPRPSRWLVLSSVGDLVIALTLAGCGWLMLPLPFWVLGSVLDILQYYAVFPDLVWGKGNVVASSILGIENSNTYHSFCRWNQTSGRYAACVYEMDT